MVKDVIVTYRMHETILILISYIVSFRMLKVDSKVVLNFKEALLVFTFLLIYVPVNSYGHGGGGGQFT